MSGWDISFENEILTYKGKTVKALVVVHVFGNMADMVLIIDEDATEVLGTYYTDGLLVGKYAGTIGDFGAYSFNDNKIITTGGAVTANNLETVDHIRYLSAQAKNDTHYYIHNEVGYNYRMTNLQTALGVVQIEKTPEFIRRKQANYELYCELFEEFVLGKMIDFREGTLSNKWFYSLEINGDRVTATMRQITKDEIKYVVAQIKEVLGGFSND